ncbi:MAG TPA: ABC transporter substrate-binding protein [Acetobacteraceae bacterium]|nr:ABC transporter substrate-binding protein [Acetobacteraceae bacterium]
MLTRRALLAAGAATAAPLGRHAEAGTPANTIVMAYVIDDAISFDPAQAYEFSTIEVDANIYRKLVAPDLNELTKIAPDLAAHWEVSSDGKSFTFYLKQNELFASGKPMTAADAEFSLHRAVTLNLTPGFILTQFGFTKDNVAQQIRATDPHTLKIDLPKPAATSFVLYCLGANIGGIVEQATALAHQEKNDLGNKWLANHSAGNGPYQLTSWQADDHLILDANPHSAVQPATRRMFIRQVKEPSEQVLLLKRGDVDLARNLTSDLLKDVANDANLYKISSPTTNQMYIAGNEAYAPFTKPEVRQALQWAIDYDGIQKNITPNTYSVNQAFEPSMILGAVTTNPFHHDPDKAKELLAKAGYPQGFSATLDHFSEHPYADIATALQANLGAVGIKVSLLPGTRKQILTKMRARQHQLVMNEWFPDYFDPNSNAQAFCADPDDSDNSPMKIIAWRTHFHDPELTAEVAQAAAELDTEKRVELYHKMQQQAWERSPIAFMLQQDAVAVVRKNVSGFMLGPQSDFVRYDKTRKT